MAKTLIERGPPWFPLSLRHCKQTLAICDELEKTWQQSGLVEAQTAVRLGALVCNLGRYDGQEQAADRPQVQVVDTLPAEMMPCNIAKGVLVVGFLRQRVYDVLQVEQMIKEEAMTRGHWLR